MMKGTTTISLLALATLCPTVKGATPPPPKHPNIILFMVDDMGWEDTSLPFWTQRTHYNDIYHTPNMERLAKQGEMFTQAYACSISSPTRCSLLSGMNAARHRVTNWTLFKDKSTDRKSPILNFPHWNVNGLAEVDSIPYTSKIKSFVDFLREADYHTIHCGKAHFGAINTPGENPCHFGFEVNIAGHAAGAPASYLGEQNFGNRTDGKPSPANAVPGLRKYWGKDIFLSEALTREAIHALEKAKAYGQPFFLYMAHYAIHIPMMADNRFYPKYKKMGLPEVEARYASMIEGMDKSLGDIMDWLEKNNEVQNTVIIFMSDNGGLAAHSRAGKLNIQNYPLKSGKGSAYEGGIREPMIVVWPGVVQPGTKTDQPVIIEDFYPTILDIAGVRLGKTPQHVDGQSFVSLLRRGTRLPHRQLYWNCPNLWGVDGPGIGPTCTVRDGDWKLIYYYQTGKAELFNIPQDISEEHDLSAKYPQITRRLRHELGSYLRRVKGQRPTFKATGQPCPWPDEKFPVTMKEEGAA